MNGSSWNAAGAGHRDRLRALAESANETARMARVNVSLTLIVALYLTLTLLTASDENIVRNTVVTLPQFETGVSLKLSYLFAPIVFVYLHGQTLFLLVVLARKVRRFEETCTSVFKDDQEAAAECRNWLSAVSLVQGLLNTGGFARAARGLTWIGTVGVPLLLLLLIDVAFLRHRSTGISLIHHVCFCADLAGVWIFWRHIGTQRPAFRWRDLFDALNPRLRHDKTESLGSVVLSARKPIAQGIAILLLVALLWIYAWPITHDTDQTPAGSDAGFHILDDLMCPLSPWGGFCRTLNLYRADLGGVDLRNANLWGANLEEADLTGADLRHVSLQYADLLNAELARANLRSADLQQAILMIADLQAADLTRANLRNANLWRANLQSARLQNVDLGRATVENANLHSADLGDASLTNANLRGANLQEANLTRAAMFGADLRGADLHSAISQSVGFQNANLREARLQNADLRGADLEDADLSSTSAQGADLRGASLRRAVLRGADLRSADLRGARLSGVDLRLANLREANMQDATLRGADLRDTNLQDALLAAADLQNADLREANLRGADMSRSDLRGAILQTTQGLLQHQIDQTCGDQRTRLPEGLIVRICTE